MRRPILATFALLLVPVLAGAQTRTLTLEDLYHPDRRIDFSGGAPTGLAWMSDTHYVWPRPLPGGGGVEWMKVDAASGRLEPLFDAARMREAFAALPGLTAEGVQQLPNLRALEMNASRTAAILPVGGDLYHYAFDTGRAQRLTTHPAAEEEFSFSPDGTMVAFVRRFNLYVVDVQHGRERQLTTDGHDQLLNGKLDWVYQEEIYGRGNYRGYWWSPDSTHLAFLQLDEAPVPEFTIIDHIPTRLDIETWDYPKAGDPNPGVRLGVVPAIGGPVRWADLTRYAPFQILIVNVSWTPDSRSVVYQVQDREQTWLDLNLVGPSGQNPTTLFRETTRAWVNVLGPPVWLKDGSFLWLSQRTGWRHVYRYSADGRDAQALTSGAWDARTLHGVDEAGGWVYYSGTEREYVGLDAWRVRLDGADRARLTAAPGTHRVTFSPGFRHFLATWSDLHTPPQVRVHAADGAEVRVVHRSEIPQLAELRRATPERLQVKTRDGFDMEAVLIRPPDFDPSATYPVIQFTYAGPGAPRVTNAWGGQSHMYHQFLAQQGIVVWLCDNRSASGKGAQSAWTSYKNFGPQELADIEDGLAYLKQQPWVDAGRIGIDGWSFGGYMTAFALTHSTSFAMGIAGGSVTDWRLYDSIYTERYMLMPQNNPEGYERSSPLRAAKNLHGQLLLIHGVIDDNVHMQNTQAFAYELQKAGKPFRLMLYERSRHGITDPPLVWHMRQMMWAFKVETLLAPGARPTNDARQP